VVGLLERASVVSGGKSEELEGSFDALDLRTYVRDSSGTGCIDDESGAELESGDTVAGLSDAGPAIKVGRDISLSDDRGDWEGMTVDGAELIKSVKLLGVTDSPVGVPDAELEAVVVSVTASGLSVDETSTFSVLWYVQGEGCTGDSIEDALERSGSVMVLTKFSEVEDVVGEPASVTDEDIVRLGLGMSVARFEGVLFSTVVTLTIELSGTFSLDVENVMIDGSADSGYMLARVVVMSAKLLVVTLQ
jgi:hypothetical protein